MPEEQGASLGEWVRNTKRELSRLNNALRMCENFILEYQATEQYKSRNSEELKEIVDRNVKMFSTLRKEISEGDQQLLSFINKVDARLRTLEARLSVVIPLATFLGAIAANFLLDRVQ